MSDPRVNDLMRRVAKLEALSRIPYVRGTFTPTYLGATTPGTTTYSTQTGAYTKIGSIVIARVDLQWTAATGTGNVKIGGLPFAANATVAYAVETSAVTFAGSGIQGLIVSGDSYGRLISYATNVGSTELTIEAAGVLRATLIYPTTG